MNAFFITIISLCNSLYAQSGRARNDDVRKERKYGCTIDGEGEP